MNDHDTQLGFGWFQATGRGGRGSKHGHCVADEAVEYKGRDQLKERGKYMGKRERKQQLDGEDAQWLAFLRAMSLLQIERMVTLATRLLDAQGGYAKGYRAILVAAAMLDKLAHSHAEQALDLLQEYGGPLAVRHYPDLLAMQGMAKEALARNRSSGLRAGSD